MKDHISTESNNQTQQIQAHAAMLDEKSEVRFEAVMEVLLKMNAPSNAPSGLSRSGSDFSDGHIPSEWIDFNNSMFIGRGGQGCVSLTTMRNPDSDKLILVALKEVPANSKTAMKAFEKECHHLRQIKNKHILSFFGTASFNKKYFMVVDYYELGSMDFVLEIFKKDTSNVDREKLRALVNVMNANHNNVTEVLTAMKDSAAAATADSDKSVADNLITEARGLICQLLGGSIGMGEETQAVVHIFHHVVCGLHHLHYAAKVLHGDLKPGNLLFNVHGNVCIADFGIAVSIENSLGSSTTASSSAGGTAGYASPEQITGSKRTFSSDVFSLAMVFYSIITGRAPFDYVGNCFMAVSYAVTQGKLPELPDTIRPELKQLLLCMMAYDPKQRPNIGLIMAMFEGSTKARNLTFDISPFRSLLSPSVILSSNVNLTLRLWCFFFL